MKKSIQILLLFSIFLSANNLLAQTFGLRVGFNLSNQICKDNDFDYAKEADYKKLPGGHLTFLVDFPVYEGFSVEPGLSLDTKGYKIKESDSDSKFVNNTYLAYISIPVNAKYAYDLGGPKIYAAVGPYLGIGIFGKDFSKTTENNQTLTNEADVSWGSGADDDFTRMDVGMNFGAGIQLGSLLIGANYGLGLTNISPNTDNGMKIKNRVLSISIGAVFGK